MSKAATRYKHVWDDGYTEGWGAASDLVLKFLKAGGEITINGSLDDEFLFKMGHDTLTIGRSLVGAEYALRNSAKRRAA